MPLTPPTSPPITRYRITVEQYDRMIQAGVFPEDAPVELVEGELLEMAPIGSRHVSVVARLTRVFVRAVGDRALVTVQCPVQLDERSEPQPDLALLRPRADDYAASLARPAEVLLLVEVAESSLAYDRSLKARLYAQAGIPEYWVVDLLGDQVVAWTQPAPGGYQAERVARRGDALAPAALPDVVVRVADLLR